MTPLPVKSSYRQSVSHHQSQQVQIQLKTKIYSPSFSTTYACPKVYFYVYASNFGKMIEMIERIDLTFTWFW